MVIWHDVSVYKVALREDLLSNRTKTRCLASSIIATQDARTVPIFADTNGNSIRFDSCFEILEVIDEIVAIILVSNWFCAELDAVKYVGRDIRIATVRENFDNGGSNLLPVFKLDSGQSQAMLQSARYQQDRRSMATQLAQRHPCHLPPLL